MFGRWGVTGQADTTMTLDQRFMQIPPLSPLVLSQLIGVSADIALLLDEAGVVQEVSLSRSDWAALDCPSSSS